MNTMFYPTTMASYVKIGLFGLLIAVLLIPQDTQAASFSNVQIVSFDNDSADIDITIFRDSRPAYVWLEYGTTPSFGKRTSKYNITTGSGTKIVEKNLKSLRPDTLYYVRAIVENKQGGQNIISGTQTFRTLGNVTAFIRTSPSPTPSKNNSSSSNSSNTSNNGTSSSTRKNSGLSLFSFFGSNGEEEDTQSTSAPRFTGSNSPFTKGYQSDYAGRARVNGATTGPYLEVVSVNNSTNANGSLMTLVSGDENAIEGSQTGDVLSWSVIYRNLSGSELAGTGIKITIPSDVELVSVSKTPTRIDGKVLFYDLGTLAAGVQDSIDLRIRVKENASMGNTLVFSSIFQYRDASNRTQSITAYMTTLVKGTGATEDIRNNLFASIGDFFTSLWLIVLALFISAGYLLYRYRMNVKKIESQVQEKIPSSLLLTPRVRPTPPTPGAGQNRPPIDEMNLPGFKVNGAH